MLFSEFFNFDFNIEILTSLSQESEKGRLLNNADVDWVRTMVKKLARDRISSRMSNPGGAIA